MSDFYLEMADNFLKENNIEKIESVENLMTKLRFDIRDADTTDKNFEALMVISDKTKFISGFLSNKGIVLNEKVVDNKEELLATLLGLYILRRNDKKDNLEYDCKIYKNQFKNKSAEAIGEYILQKRDL